MTDRKANAEKLFNDSKPSPAMRAFAEWWADNCYSVKATPEEAWRIFRSGYWAREEEGGK